MRTEDIKKARELRKEGKSIKFIAKTLIASRGSVSLWIRDIILTDEQKEILAKNMKFKSSYDKRMASCIISSRKAKENRDYWRNKGKLQAIEKDWLFTLGCSLYWAEGTKKNNRNAVHFSNSDLKMLHIFILFLTKSLGIHKDKIVLYINCYTDIHTKEEIEKYWLDNLNIKRKNMRKTMVNNISNNSKNRRRNILEWGTCRITVNDTTAIQRIYGAIEEFENIAAVI